jgi:hypothetical protein
MAKHLRFDMEVAYKSGVKGFPPQVIEELGITFQHANIQGMVEQWWFWNCENIPEQLPGYITVANWNPMELIGFALSQEQAEKIRDYNHKNETK